MIRIRILRNGQSEEIGFRSEGHADCGAYGKDIVCAAVSVLELNLANSLSELTEAKFDCETNEKTGGFFLRLADRHSPDAVLLLRSCLLGLRAIEAEYGEKVIQINDQEV